jgi:hypothetical protein
MTDPYNPFPMRQHFAVGVRVLVSGACGGWRKDSRGVVVAAPEPVQTVQGEDYFYWVQFDSPQHDLSDDGPYSKAQVLSRCLCLEA